MYLILFASVREDGSASNWAVLDEVPSITEGGEYIAKEMAADIWNGEQYAYRIIEAPC